MGNIMVKEHTLTMMELNGKVFGEEVNLGISQNTIKTEKSMEER